MLINEGLTTVSLEIPRDDTGNIIPYQITLAISTPNTSDIDFNKAIPTYYKIGHYALLLKGTNTVVKQGFITNTDMIIHVEK